MKFIHPRFESYAREHGFFSDDLIRQVTEQGSLANIDGVPDEAKRLFVTAREIAPEWHVRMRASFQKHIDHSRDSVAKPLIQVATYVAGAQKVIVRYEALKAILNPASPVAALQSEK